jgi:hypothetical protein
MAKGAARARAGATVGGYMHPIPQRERPLRESARPLLAHLPTVRMLFSRNMAGRLQERTTWIMRLPLSAC